MNAQSLAVPFSALLLVGSASAQCDSTVLTPGNPFDHQHFGRSVAVSADTAMVGVWVDEQYNFEHGRVYVHERTPAGWAQTQVLTCSDTAPGWNDEFGWDVSIYRDTALISWQGLASYIFERGPNQWVETVRLPLAPPSGSNFRGCSVSLFGNTAVVGDWADNSQAGSAQVYEKLGRTWTRADVLTPSSCVTHCWFGEDVAVHGNRILVGAGGLYSPDPGAAYFYRRTPAGWVETQKVTASDGVAGDWFGGSVAIYQNTAVVGAENSGGIGAAYVFRWTPAGWVEDAKLTPGAGIGSSFGRGVAVNWTPDAGVRVLVSGTGGAHLYRRGPTSWERIAVFQGGSLEGPAALFGDTSVIGAPDSSLVNDEAGAAYLFSFPTFADPYCFCSGGPCNNDDSHAGCQSSTGSGALLEACGTGSVAADDLALVVTGVPANQFGIFYMGGGQTHNPFGDGLRCVSPGGSGVFRYPVQNSGASGTLVQGPGTVALSHALFGPAGRISAGQIWNFQGWFRDPGGPCGNDFNLSNGLRISFAP